VVRGGEEGVTVRRNLQQNQRGDGHHHEVEYSPSDRGGGALPWLKNPDFERKRECSVGSRDPENGHVSENVSDSLSKRAKIANERFP
jgi:hypothetical protein